ncbi:MAG: DUF302 domain-containing protein [Deltaproteobacteria bacterium]|nr:DUF302 domain-containing protein [Deltaproteobacteria bacterium]
MSNPSPAYGMFRQVNLPYAQAVTRITETLKEQGFGILTEIDVKATMKKKIDKDVPAQVILGACNPNLAFRAMEGEPAIGLLLPCNVVVREDAAGNTIVGILNPDSMVEMTGNMALKEVAVEARQRLTRALEAI